MTGNLDVGNKQITNLGYNISNPSDVVNLAFCDIKYLQKTSNSDLDMNENYVKNMLDPVDEQDAINKRFLEARLHDYLKTNGQNPMTFNLNMSNYKIMNLKNFDSSDTTDVPNIKYIKDNYVNRSLGILQGNLNANNNKIINLTLPTNIEDAVNKQYTDDNFLKLDGTVSMTSDLDMGTNKIKNLGTPAKNENDAAVSVWFFNSEVNASNQNLSAQLTAAYKKYVNESHVTPSGHVGENAFRYLMEDVDESSSENNISVIGIVSYGASIHQMNKKAYQLSLVKDSGSNNYRSRIGFNLGSLPIGYYTFVCEFFPPVMTNVSVTAIGTTISINNQTTKTFSRYTKTLVQFHRWNSTPPQFIYLDLHGSVPSNNPRALALMVVYGVKGLKGYFPNVPSSVFDQVYVVDNGRMVMQTDLDLHGHRLMNNEQGGVSFDSGGVISIHDNLNTNGYSIVGRNGGFEIRDDGSIRLHGTLDLNGHRIDGVINFSAGEIVILKNINMNGHSIKNSSNLRYSINGTFDRDHNTEVNKTIYFTFDKLTYFIFSTPSVIKDYILDIQETDTNNVYDSHDILFIIKQYDLNSNATPTTLRRILKSHPNGRHFSFGNLQINMPRMSIIQIAIGKNYNGSRFDRASIKYARLALTIEM